MKICLVSNLYEPYIMGGAEVVTQVIADEMAARGHDVMVITTHPKRGPTAEERIGRVAVKRFYPANLYFLMDSKTKPGFLKPFWHALDIWNPDAYFKTRQILKEFQPDIINTMNIFGLSAAVWSAARSLNIPIVHSLHDYALLCPKTTMLRKDTTICKTVCPGCFFFSYWKKVFAKHVRAVISPSKFLLSIFEKNNMFKGAMRYVIYNGVAMPKQQAGTSPEETINFLYLGQVSAHKGIETLVKAFRQLPFNNVRLHVTGRGDLLPKIKELAAADDRIIFHDFVSRENKDALLQKSRALILPSVWWEPFGRVILEAHAFGLPVIASRIGAIPELVEEEKTGFLFEPGDQNDLLDKLTTFINRQDRIEEFRQNCLKKAEEMNLQRQVEQYETVYRELAGSKKS